MKLGKYLYGIIPRQSALELEVESLMPQLGGIHTIEYDELAALVSTAPLKVYVPEKELVLKHEKVVASIMKTTTIIPARYGLVAKKADEIKEVLRINYSYLFNKIKELEGKVELSLRVFWQKDKMAADIENEELKRIRAELESQQAMDQAIQLQLGEMAFHAVEAKRAEYVKEIFESLQEKAVSAKLNQINNVRMICNCAFLVSKEDESGFDALVNDLYLKHRDILDFKYSGPWPPYNFVDLALTFAS